MADPLVSVIVPFYNCDEFLVETICSVKSQTYSNVEVIVVDDCSPRRSAQEILSESEFCDATVIRHEQNSGPSAARNTAVRHARGQYILPLDADDVLVPSYLRSTMDAIATGDWGGAYTDIECFGDEQFVHESDPTPAGIMNARGGSVTFLYKREVYDSVGGYNEKFRLAEDKDFWLSAFSKGWKFIRVPEPLLRYRRHKESLSHDIHSHLDEVMIDLFHAHKQFYIERIDEWFPIKEREFWQQGDCYNKLLNQWELDHRVYLDLQNEFNVLHEKYNKLAEDTAKVMEAYQGLRRGVFWWILTKAKHMLGRVPANDGTD